MTKAFYKDGDFVELIPDDWGEDEICDVAFTCDYDVKEVQIAPSDAVVIDPELFNEIVEADYISYGGYQTLKAKLKARQRLKDSIADAEKGNFVEVDRD